MRDEALNMTYRELDRDLALLSRRMYRGEGGEADWYVPDDGFLKNSRRRLQELQQRVEALDAPDAVYDALKNHFQDFTETLGFVLDGLEQDPLGEFTRFQQTLHRFVRMDIRPDAEKQKDLVALLNDYQVNRDVLIRLANARMDEAARNRSAAALTRAAEKAGEEAGRLHTYFPGLTDLQRMVLEEAICAYAQQCEDMAGKIGTGPVPAEQDDLTVRRKLAPEVYRRILKSRMGVDPDELLDWGRTEYERTRAEVFEIAEKACGGRDVPTDMQGIADLLFEKEPPAANAEEMFARIDEYLVRARKVAREYVKLPEEERCVCVEIPEYMKDSSPWGFYEGGDFKRGLTGHMFLNQYNVPNISDGWIKLNAMHEAYPGHHVQYVRTAVDPTPETVKIGAKLMPLLEGACIRTERAFEDTFPEDPFYPLFVAYRRHHTAVRIFVDLQLFYYGCTVGEAVEIYRRELGLDPGTARAQVRAHEHNPGYFTCYYYGMKKITGLEAELGFSKKDFTEICFSAGYVSMTTFEKLVRMTEAERQRYYHDFKSLLRD